MYRILIVLTCLIIISSCGRDVISKANPVYSNEKISSVVMLCNFHLRKNHALFSTGEDTTFYDDFEEAMRDEFTNKSINIKCVVMNKYKFDKPDTEKIISDMNPTAVITIEEGDSIIFQGSGLIKESYYNVEIINNNSKEKMWQAELHVVGNPYTSWTQNNNGAYLAAILFEDIVNTTKDDKMMLFQ